jgi:hypothetical protein
MDGGSATMFLPKRVELELFVSENCEEIPVIVGSTPNGHMYVGWHPDAAADEKVAECIDQIYALPKPIWPRKIHSRFYHSSILIA